MLQRSNLIKFAEDLIIIGNWELGYFPSLGLSNSPNLPISLFPSKISNLKWLGWRTVSREQSALWPVNRVFYNNSLVAARTERNNCDRHCHQICQKLQIIQSLLWQIFQIAAVFRRLFPTGKRSE